MKPAPPVTRTSRHAGFLRDDVVVRRERAGALVAERADPAVDRPAEAVDRGDDRPAEPAQRPAPQDVIEVERVQHRE